MPGTVSPGEGCAAARPGEVATFRELYRSRDGRITVFEDAQGHLTAVDSSRLDVPQGARRVDDSTTQGVR